MEGVRWSEGRGWRGGVGVGEGLNGAEAEGGEKGGEGRGEGVEEGRREGVDGGERNRVVSGWS